MIYLNAFMHLTMYVTSSLRRMSIVMIHFDPFGNWNFSVVQSAIYLDGVRGSIVRTYFEFLYRINTSLNRFLS